MKRKRILTILLPVVLLASAAPAFAQVDTGVPKEVQGVGVDQRPGDKLPLDITVIDSRGQRGRLARYFTGRRPVLLTLNYSSCPMLCSLQLNQLVSTLNTTELKIGSDFDIITLSIDPKEMTQTVRETKDRYISSLRNQPGAESGWHFLTASQGAIEKLTDAVGFRYRYDELTKEYYHPAMLAFITPDGVISRYSLEVTFPENQFRMAVVESSQGRVGSVVDQFLLLCFRYDEERNRYVASAWRIMRFGALTTVALLLVTLTPYWIGRRRTGSEPVAGELSDANSDSLS